jgi:adenylate cyclase
MSVAVEVASFRFEGFVLDTQRNTLVTTRGQTVSLRHKSFRLLCLFAEKAGLLVGRDLIIQTVWSGMNVSDDSITQCVRDIRLALGDTAQTTIKTVRGRGYIFTAKVTLDHSDGQLPNCGIPAGKPSVAVLPFVTVSGNPEHEYFSDGLTDDVINSLSRSGSLFVTARNSSFAYKNRAIDVKQIARELGVRYVVEGSVRQHANRVRVNARLIDAETGNHIRAERYDGIIKDVFAIQDEITEALTIAINPAVAETELRRALRKSPHDLGAWEAYQHGLWHLAKGDETANERAKEYFNQSIAIDASFAAAYSALALVFKREGDTYGVKPLDEAEARGDDWARRAVEIDPTDADGLAILAFSTPYAARAEAYERIALALDSNPNSSRAHCIRGTYLVFDGRPLEARDALLKAFRLNSRDPMNAMLPHFISISYYFAHDYATAVKIAKHAITQHPDYPLTYRWLAAALGQLKRYDEAGHALRRAVEVSPGSFEFYTRNRPPWMRTDDYTHMLEGLHKAGWQGR